MRLCIGCSWPELMNLFDQAKNLLLDNGLMTSSTFAQLKLQRLEEKRAAEQRIEEQRMRDLEATAEPLTSK